MAWTPASLILEITEDALIGETGAAGPVADRLRGMGLQLWLDDFGTGYSSLLSLRQISLQAVKIDIAFVANIHTDPEAARFLRALLALGRDLDLAVVAEGVGSRNRRRSCARSAASSCRDTSTPYPAPAAEFDDLLGPRPAPKTPPIPPGAGSPATARRANRVNEENAAAAIP